MVALTAPKMITEIVVFISFLVENCTGIALIETYTTYNNRAAEPAELEEALIGERPQSDLLVDFIEFDQDDHIFQEFDPPENDAADPKAWKKSLPPLKTTLKECLKNVLLIQTVCGSIIGLLVVGIIILDFTFGEWCYDMKGHWNQMPKKVQSMRVTTQAIEGGLIQMWDFTCIIAVFPLSLIKDLHLLTLNVLAAFMDTTYRLYLQMIGKYQVSWMSFPLNVLFTCVILINNYLLARKFYPLSLKNTLKLDFILSAQFVLGLPAALILVYGIFPWYVEQDDHFKVIIAFLSPIVTAIPKVVARLGAQTLSGIVHPGSAIALVPCLYAASAVVFRVMQSDITNFGLFVALGIAHAAIDLVERITVTMRDQIWECLHRYVLRRNTPTPKYRSLRSRRFVADLTIQIILQEATGLVSSLGYMTVYQILYTQEKPNVNRDVIVEFFKRVSAGLFIDLVFNTISLVIQTRVMNIAVGRVWRKRWRYHLIVNTLGLSISAIYFSEYLFKVVQDKYSHIHQQQNCSYPYFL